MAWYLQLDYYGVVRTARLPWRDTYSSSIMAWYLQLEYYGVVACEAVEIIHHWEVLVLQAL